MLAPTGDQFEIEGGGYRAVVTECGAGLRVLEHAGRPLVDGVRRGRDAERRDAAAADAVAEPDPRRRLLLRRRATTSCRCPSRRRRNAAHGLARWAAWTVEEHTPNSVSLGYRLMAQSGYPWTLDLHVLYDLSADGLTVTQTASNMSASAAPYAQGAHPYLVAEPDRIDGLELLLPGRDPAARRRPDAPGRPRAGRGHGVRLPGAAAGPGHGARRGVHRPRPRRAGVATVELRDPATGRGVALWADARHGWLQVYSGDDRPVGPHLPGRGADDRAGRRLPLRRRPGHPLPRRRARRRAVGVLGRSGALV